MEDLSVSMEQNIAIVAILCLDDVHDQAIRCQTLHKVLLCLDQVLLEVDLEEVL